MTKTCTNCGNIIDEGMTTCAVCGAAAPAPRTRRPAPKKTGFAGLMQKLSKNPKMLLGGAAALVVVTITLIVVLSALFSNPWKSGLNNYLDLTIKGKSSAVIKMVPKDAWTFLEDNYSIDKASMKEDAEAYAEDLSEGATDNYGDKVKYKYNVLKKKRLTRTMTDKYAEGIENVYGIDQDKVKTGYMVKFELEVSGKEGFAWTEKTCVFLKIGSAWYMVGETGTTADNKPYCTLEGLTELMRSETFAENMKTPVATN